ncbi:MAG: cache domain-containing protein [Pseudomonadota bacterium]
MLPWMSSRRTTTLRLTLSFVTILLVANAVLSVAFVNYLQQVLIGQVQESVRLNLNSAREIYQHQIEGISMTLAGAVLQNRIVSVVDGSGAACDDERLRRLMAAGDLDILALLDRDARVVCVANAAVPEGLLLEDELVVGQTLGTGKAAGGTSILSGALLAAFDPALAARASIDLVATPAALPTATERSTDGMLVEAAVPVLTDGGEQVGVLWGANLLNRRTEVVDAVREEVFQNRRDRGKDIGTATIFQRDLRIATNVATDEGERAIGTRMSAEVAQRVLEEGGVWADRAFVVNDWYLTAYEPIRDPQGDVIGALYVGVLEAPYQRQRLLLALVFLAFVACTTLASLALLVYATRQVLHPIGRVVAMSQRVVQGDLTARVGLEAPGELGQLCRAVDEMAEAVRKREERLVQLTQAQLYQSEKLASIGRLAAGIAHEINNPLTGVLTFAHLLREKPHLTEEDLADLEVICKETARVRDIVRGLLDFARESPSHRLAVDLNQLVQETIRLLRTQKVFRGLRIELRLDPDLPSLHADPNQLKQVLLNLTLNACEAMSGGGVLAVETRVAGGHAELSVQDTGCGIPAENMDKLFDPFFTTKPVGKGTGLGLSVTYGIVQAHGGLIKVLSRPGEGSTFTVELPLAAA